MFDQIIPIDFEYFRTAWFALTTIIAICFAAIGVLVELKEDEL